MKRFVFSVMILTLLSVILYSCDPNAAKKELLKKHIEEAQSNLPRGIGNLGAWTGIHYENDMVTLTYLMNENECDIDVLNEDSLLVKENFQCLIIRNRSINDMVKEIAAASASLTLKYKGGTSGKMASVTIKNSELASDKFILTSTEAAEKIIQNSLRMERKKLPMDMGDGIKLVDSFWEGDNLVYHAVLSRQIYPKNALRYANIDEMKKGIMNGFVDNPSYQNFVDAFVTLRRNICYRYQVEGSSEYVDVILYSSDLRSLRR